MKRILIAGLLIIFISINALAYNRGAGVTVGSTLLRGQVGAAPAALGGAYTAFAEGPLSLRYNPAGLADETRKKLFLQYNAHILDIDRSDIALTVPLNYGAFGISFSLIDYGDITRTTTINKNGIGIFSPKDYFLKIGYGRQVSERMQFGGTIGVYTLELDQDARAEGITADFGLKYNSPIDNLILGAGIKNIGTKARFYFEREELPLLFVLGLAYKPIPQLLLLVDGELIDGEGSVIHAGAEYTVAKRLKFRVGYNGENETDNGLTAGAGFATDDLSLDYAYIPFGEFGNSHQISLEVKFGKPVERKAKVIERRVERIETLERKPEPLTDTEQVIQTPIETTTAPEEEKIDIQSMKDKAAQEFSSGRFESALRLFIELETLTPTDYDLKYNIATAYYSMKHYEEALNEYGKYLELVPSDDEAWLYKGYSEYHLNRINSAKHSWRRALEINPDNEYARAALSQTTNE